MYRRGIALLLTAMFVIVITVAIGYALRSINSASTYVEKEKGMYQDFIFVEDMMNILQNSPELKQLATDQDAVALYTFISSSGFLTFEHSGVNLVIEITSARSGVPINDMLKNPEQKNFFFDYLGLHNIRGDYLELLEDASSGLKNNYYKTRLFDLDPTLFRDYIASAKHFNIINKYYINEYRDDTLKEINFEKMFTFSREQNLSIDLNYATAEAWELIAGIDHERAEILASEEVFFTSPELFEETTLLSPDEKLHVKKFPISFFEPFLNVKMDIIRDNVTSHINFEYDIKTGGISNFVYEI